ncbi:helix-turn-helix transcriptional regulator [Ruegeria arenilitoris]|uniref:helix-turn-helix transcriptional regulator n=1 Tax=Ruegeria arenilitoris TaxID=1173585 RepID=UPI00147CFAD0|nr:AlpA family transcriptional regulator [Ruegeria arenilitoris]
MQNTPEQNSCQERATSGERLLAYPEVVKIVGFKRTKIYEMMNNGEFPKPIKIGRASRWSQSELTDWIEGQKAARLAA